jgi:hypothetical protein
VLGDRKTGRVLLAYFFVFYATLMIGWRLINGVLRAGVFNRERRVMVIGGSDAIQGFVSAIEGYQWADSPHLQCREDPAVMRAVNGASMASADGMPVVWMQRRLGLREAERVYGPDVMLGFPADCPIISGEVRPN